MIDVRVGTTHALEVREDPEGKQVVVPVDGERTISFLMPDGVSSMDASSQVIGALNGMMMEAGATPWWIESSDQAVVVNLTSHYGIEQSQMPAAWGDGTTSGVEPQGTMLQQAPSAPPDSQDESTPILPPEQAASMGSGGEVPSSPAIQSEPEPEAEVIAQSTTTKTTRTRKKAAAPEPTPEVEVDDAPEPEMQQPESQPEETP